MKIYVPDITNACYVVLDNQTIRSYEINPNENLGIQINYRDYFVNSHYLYRDNNETLTTVINCLSGEQLTNDWYYRNDLADILIIITVFCVFCFYIPLVVFSRLFKRFR
ncbi:MAG: hypothetical protein PHS24_04330 [Bacilli bacterium]|nr:hypothetical protein [Bacilli bacterium]